MERRIYSDLVPPQTGWMASNTSSSVQREACGVLGHFLLLNGRCNDRPRILDPNQLRPGPIRQESLSPELLKQIKAVFDEPRMERSNG